MASIKLTNSVKLHSNSLMDGIDVSNILTSFSSVGSSWTATADCWCYWNARSGGEWMWIKLDGVEIAGVFNNNAGASLRGGFPVKTGQVVSCNGDAPSYTGIYMAFFGLV